MEFNFETARAFFYATVTDQAEYVTKCLKNEVHMLANKEKTWIVWDDTRKLYVTKNYFEL